MHRPVRTSLLVITAVAAIAMSLITIASYLWPLCVKVPANDHNWVIAHWFDGRMRVFWIKSAERPITIEHQPAFSQPRFMIHSEGPPEYNADPFTSSALPSSPNFNIMISIGSRRDVPAFGFFWPWKGIRRQPGAVSVTIRFVRFPFWLPAGILVIISVEGMRRGPMRRRQRWRRGLCLSCGYALRGLPEPRCPECGVSISADQCHQSGTGDGEAT